ncbi:MAG TPA: ROK family protein [Candidatus Sulfotelmatobacter sp.]
MTRSNAVIGVDIGGTKVAVGMVDRNGRILSQMRHPMVANSSPDAALKAVISAIDAIRAAERLDTISEIGLAAPGPLDPKTGVVINPPNLPCWRNFPLAAKVAETYGATVKLDNDANAAALAETLWGAARGYRYVFYATIGTGIGTGIVFDNRIYHGHTGAAGEGGHVSIDYNGPVCGCGKKGCIEILAAGPAISARARAKFAVPDRKSALLELAQGKVNTITSEMVGIAFQSGDAVAREILHETSHLLAIWLGNIIDVLDPDVIVMGGGVAAMLKPFYAEIKQTIPKWSVNPTSSKIPLLMAHYGPDAGVAGAAALCY